MLRAILYNREGRLESEPGITWRVNACDWRAIGGAHTATLRGNYDWLPDYAQFGTQGLARLAGLLRYAVELRDDADLPAWWGFVSGVEFHKGGLRVRLSLDGMANRVRVAFVEAAPGRAGGGAEQFTAWLEDAQSQQIYGIKEACERLGAVSSAQAQAVCAARLQERKFPPGEVQTCPPTARTPQAERPAVTLRCRGWWHTLSWRTYACPAGREDHTASGLGVQPIGDTAANTCAAQSLRPDFGGWAATEAWLLVRRVGSPADNLVIELCADAGGAPGAALAGSALAGGSLPANYKWLRAALSPAVVVSAGTTCWLSVRRSGGLDALNTYRLQVDEGLGYPRGALRLFNGATWGGRTPDADLNFRLAGEMETSRQIRLAVAAGGQFLSGAVVPESGVFANPYRQGLRTALDEITDWLAGGDGARRWLAEVDASRMLRVQPLPDAAELDVRLGEDGALCNRHGLPLPLHERQVGRWARVDVPWVQLGAGAAYPLETVFLWQAQYDGETGRVYPQRVAPAHEIARLGE